jgi:hypothetical protein
VQKGLVGQVHQVVQHEPVVALNVQPLAAVGVAGIRGHTEVRDQAGIGQLGITEPDPAQLVPVCGRVRGH